MFIRHSGLDRAGLLKIVGISSRTLERKSGENLTREQSDRVARVARTYRFATDALGDRERARKWLEQPNRALSGEKPLDLLDTDIGVRSVERTLARIRDGSVA